MNNPYLKRLSKKSKGEHGRKSEKRVASRLNAQLTPGSGAIRGFKSDSRIKGKIRWQIESKATKAKTLSLELAWLVKITDEAMSTGSNPLLTFSFVDNDGKPLPNGDWVAMPLKDFEEMKERLGG